MTYMDRAKALEPDNAQVRKAYNGLLRAQADWCKQQGEELTSRGGPVCFFGALATYAEG